MNVERAAAYLGISTSKLMELVDSGKAPAPPDLGGCPRWDRRALDEFMDSLSGYSKKSRKTVSEMLEAERGSDQAEVRPRLQRPTRPTAPLLSSHWR
jgi:excisionase family DNA binding protein